MRNKYRATGLIFHDRREVAAVIAPPHVASYLQVSKNFPILLVRLTSRDMLGKPFDYYESHARNDVVTIVSAISPYAEARDTARALIGDFCEIYVKAPLEVCAERDTKGLYAKAMSGELQGFTGVNDPYEAPENAELVLDTEHNSVEDNANIVLAWMEEQGYLTPAKELANA